MSLGIEPEAVPLRMSLDGVILVGGTRVTLDTVLAAVQGGAALEDVARQYPALDPTEVDAVIDYYLRHRPEVDAYLRRRYARSDSVRLDNEARCDPRGVRDRLLARRLGACQDSPPLRRPR